MSSAIEDRVSPVPAEEADAEEAASLDSGKDTCEVTVSSDEADGSASDETEADAVGKDDSGIDAEAGCSSKPEQAVIFKVSSTAISNAAEAMIDFLYLIPLFPFGIFPFNFSRFVETGQVKPPVPNEKFP